MERIVPSASRAAAALAVGLWLALASVLPAAAQSASEAAASYPAAEATIQTSHDYLIRQGDEVTVTVFGEPTLTPPQPLRVLQGGAITVPLVGNVQVGGLTTLAASQAVAQRMRRYLRAPQVTVAIFSVGPVEALVLGNVKAPGKYTLPPPARLTDVLAAAGGLGLTNGDFPEARIESPDGSVSHVPLQKLLHDGDTSLNASVPSGATVYVTAPSTFNVRVVGAVEKPGDVELHEGDDLAMAIARAGTSSQTNSDLNHITVTRVGPDGKATVQTVDLYGILKRGDLASDIALKKNDLIYVPSSPNHSIGGAASVLLLLRALI